MTAIYSKSMPHRYTYGDDRVRLHVSPELIKNGRSLTALSLAAKEISCAIKHENVTFERPDRDSVSGTYLVRQASTKGAPHLVVFKPRDEESREEDDDVLSDFCPGDGAFREAAAFLLDHSDFVGVPETATATIHTNGESVEGALQLFVENIGDTDDFGPSKFSTEDVQRIAMFDIRVLNADRHEGNVLVTHTKEGEHRLRPIDHGYILPDNARTLPWPVWMNWPQAREPVSDSVRQYILSLDEDHDVALLRKNFGDNLSTKALNGLLEGTALLKLGVSCGMSLYDIGRLVYSPDRGSKSTFELVLSESLEDELCVLHAPAVNIEGDIVDRKALETAVQDAARTLSSVSIHLSTSPVSTSSSTNYIVDGTAEAFGKDMEIAPSSPTSDCIATCLRGC